MTGCDGLTLARERAPRSRMTKANKGRAFYTSPGQLGSFLMVDYMARRKLKRGV